MVTYNKILNEFNRIANFHRQINNFGNGTLDEVNSFDNNGKFPILWVVPQRVQLGNNSMIYTIRVMVFDINNTDDSLDEEILSDTILILNDVMVELNNNPFISGEEVSVINTPSATPFRQKFTDYCVGWFADFDIEVSSFNSSCQ